MLNQARYFTAGMPGEVANPPPHSFPQSRIVNEMQDEPGGKSTTSSAVSETASPPSRTVSSSEEPRTITDNHAVWPTTSVDLSISRQSRAVTNTLPSPDAPFKPSWRDYLAMIPSDRRSDALQECIAKLSKLSGESELGHKVINYCISDLEAELPSVQTEETAETLGSSESQ